MIAWPLFSKLYAMEFQALSLLYIDSNDEETNGDEIRIKRHALDSWLEKNEYPPGGAILVRVTNPITEISRICCLGAPIVECERNHVYMPPWILENLGIPVEDIDSHVMIEPFLEPLPKASRIYLKPMDNAVYHTDIRECFERALDHFHALQEGMMLSVRVEALGGYEVSAYVDRLEPASIVAIGGEVEVEFLQPEGGVPEFVPATTASAATEFETFGAFEPVASAKTVVPPQDYKAIQASVRESWLRKFEKDKGSK